MRRLFTILGWPTLFPLFAGLCYVAFSSQAYFGLTPFEALRPALAFAIVQGLLLLVLSRFTTAVRAGLVVLGLTFLMITPLSGKPGSLALVVLMALIVVMLRRLGHPVGATRTLAGVLNLVTGGALALLLGLALAGGHIELSPSTNVARDCPTGLTPSAERPNIYMFLLDGHARQDTLKRVFNYDEEPWLAQLEAAGFSVDRTSHSNYAHTESTTASMLNLMTIQDQPAIMADLEAGKDLYSAPVDAAIKHSRVDQILECAGYETVATDMPMSRFARTSSDRYLTHGQVGQFEIVLMQETRITSLLDMLAPGWLDSQHRNRLEAAMDDAAALASQLSTRPRFTWIHMLSPHMPPAWSGNGPYPTHSTSLTHSYFADNAHEREESPEAYIAGYRSNLDHLHARLLETVKAIETSDPSAVIILFSDHGSGAYLQERLEGSDLAERFGNLFAVRTPGRADVFGSDPVTPLKIFSRLFNAYLGTELADPTGADGTWFGPVPSTDGKTWTMTRVQPWPSPIP